MLTDRQGKRLPDWLDAVQQDDLPSLHTLAAGIARDLDAVTAGLTLSLSSGAVEGHANRIKVLKRRMFGRAGFQLLRKRVLLAQWKAAASRTTSQSLRREQDRWGQVSAHSSMTVQASRMPPR